jgi:hypothetical protein
MSNPADTNQASEVLQGDWRQLIIADRKRVALEARIDELDNILRSLAYDAMESGVDNSKHGYVYGAVDELLPTAKTAIQSIIRTEKLKLLAEVRGRVIGENDRGTITDPDSPSYGEQYESTMADKDDLRAALTKLEAEL